MQVDNKQVSYSANKEHNTILVKVTSPDRLRMECWRFWVDGFEVWLDGFWIQEREAKQHKWKETANYSRCFVDISDLKVEDVDVPDWIWDLVRNKIRTSLELKRLKVSDQVRAVIEASKEVSTAIKREKV